MRITVTQIAWQIDLNLSDRLCVLEGEFSNSVER